jgi:hypothetical protein
LRVETTPFAPDQDVDAEEMLRAVLSEHVARAPNGAITLNARGSLPLLAADRRALRMLFNTLLDGLTTACGGRASIECTLGSEGLRPSLEMVVLPAGRHGDGDRPAYLGVLRDLSQRLAGALDASLTIEPYGAGWRVGLRFAAPASLPNADFRLLPPSVQSLRKSA